MADNLRKYTTQEVLNKVYTDSSGDSIGINSSTTKETLNAVFDETDNSLNVALSGGTISGDVTIEGDLTVNGSAANSYDEIVNGDLHVKSDSGNSTSAFLVEQNDGTDVFIVDTTNEQVKVGDNFIVNASGTTPVLTITGTRNDILFTESDTTNLNTLVRHQTGLFRIDTINDALDTSQIRFTIDHSTGNVSIGSAEDSSKFLQFKRGGSGSGVVRGSIGTNNSKLTFIGGSGTSSHMTLDSSGNFGINRTDPEEKLHVSGNVKLFESGNTADKTYSSTGAGLFLTSYQSDNGSPYTKTSDIVAGSDGTVPSEIRFFTRTSGGANLTNALTIDSSQDATFSGTIKADSSTSSDIITFLSSSDSTDNVVIKNFASGNFRWSQLDINHRDGSSVDTTPFSYAPRNADIKIDSVTGHDLILLESGGSVGIGTTNPVQGQSTPISDIKLDVLGNQMLSDLSTTNSDQSKLFFFRSDGAVGSQGQVPSGLKIGAVEWTALTDADDNNSITSARIEAEASNVWDSAANRNAKITFSTVGSNSLGTRLVLDEGSRISLSNNDSGAANTVFGYEALDSFTATGHSNTVIGHQAARNASANAWQDNVAIGYRALYNSGAQNLTDCVIIGSEAGYSISSTAPDGTVAIGSSSLYSLTSGTGNLAVGYRSGLNVTTGADNVGVGEKTLGGNSSTAITGDANTAVGWSAGSNLEGAAANNTIVGKNSGFSMTTGSNNVIVGKSSGDAITTTDACTLVGVNSGTNINHTDAEGTVAFGYKSLELLTNGRYNTSVGYASLAASANGDKNTAVGFQSLGDVTGSSDGDNTAIGFNAGHTGSNDLTSGTANTLIGSSTGVSSATGVNQTVIGYNATGLADNSVTLGNASVTNVYLSTDRDARLHCGGVDLGEAVDSADAEVLDDYEEGTWTPTFVSASGHAPTITATLVNDWTKIGNVVTVSCYITFGNDGGGTDQVQISGLPYALSANVYFVAPASVRRTNFTSNIGIDQYALAVSNTDDIALYYTNATGDREGLTYSDIDTASNNIMLTFTYLDI